MQKKKLLFLSALFALPNRNRRAPKRWRQYSNLLLPRANSQNDLLLYTAGAVYFCIKSNEPFLYFRHRHKPRTCCNINEWVVATPTKWISMAHHPLSKSSSRFFKSLIITLLPSLIYCPRPMSVSIFPS